MIASGLVLVVIVFYFVRSLIYNLWCNLLVIYRSPSPMQRPNNWKADVKGRVYIVTGITNAIGIEVAKDLVRRGASVVLYYRSSEKEIVQRLNTQLREETGADMLTAIECDCDLEKAVSLFTDWFFSREDTRLDGIVCCLNTFCLRDGPYRCDMTFQIDFSSQCLLVSKFEACLISQPSNRDLRIIFTIFPSESYHICRFDELDYWGRRSYYSLPSAAKRFGLSQNSLASYGFLLQRQIGELERLEGKRRNIQVYVVNAGPVRGMLPTNYTLTDKLLQSPKSFLAYRRMRTGAEAAESIFYALYTLHENEKVGWAKLIEDCQVRDKIPKPYTDISFQLKIYDKVNPLLYSKVKFDGKKTGLPPPSCDYENRQTVSSEDEEEFTELGGDKWDEYNHLRKSQNPTVSRNVSIGQELPLSPSGEENYKFDEKKVEEEVKN